MMSSNYGLTSFQLRRLSPHSPVCFCSLAAFRFLFIYTVYILLSRSYTFKRVNCAVVCDPDTFECKGHLLILDFLCRLQRWVSTDTRSCARPDLSCNSALFLCCTRAAPVTSALPFSLYGLPISSSYLRPWRLSAAAPAKDLHWCVLNKTLICHSACDSPEIYVTFMTFTFRKGYRSAEFSGSRVGVDHLCNDMGWIPVTEKLYRNTHTHTHTVL